MENALHIFSGATSQKCKLLCGLFFSASKRLWFNLLKHESIILANVGQALNAHALNTLRIFKLISRNKNGQGNGV